MFYMFNSLLLWTWKNTFSSNSKLIKEKYNLIMKAIALFRVGANVYGRLWHGSILVRDELSINNCTRKLLNILYNTWRQINCHSFLIIGSRSRVMTIIINLIKDETLRNIHVYYIFSRLIYLKMRLHLFFW